MRECGHFPQVNDAERNNRKLNVFGHQASISDPYVQCATPHFPLPQRSLPIVCRILSCNLCSAVIWDKHDVDDEEIGSTT